MKMDRRQFLGSDSSVGFPGAPTLNSMEHQGLGDAVEEEVAEEDIGDSDVLLGRGKSFTKHPGIVRFQSIINMNIDRYFAVSAHQDKKDITDEIVKEIEKTGRFLRYEPQRKKWHRINHETARTKVAQAIQYRQRRRAKGYDISSIEGISTFSSGSPQDVPARPAQKKRRPSPSEHLPLTRPRLATTTSEPSLAIFGSRELPQRGQSDSFGTSMRNQWSAPSSVMSGSYPQQPSNNRLYEQSLDLAVNQLQLRQQHHQQQHPSYSAARGLESLRFFPYTQPQVSQPQVPRPQQAAIPESLEPIHFESMNNPPSLLPAVAMAPNPTDPMWQMRLLQAIQQEQQQNGLFHGPQTDTVPRNSGPVGSPQQGNSSHASATRTPDPQSLLTTATSNFASEMAHGAVQPLPHHQQDPDNLDPLPFEVAPHETKSYEWAAQVGDDVAWDDDRKPPPKRFPP